MLPRNTSISYDPNGSGENYGIQFNGHINKLLKFILILANKGVTIPTPSHHGLQINLKDYPYKLVLMYHKWTHDNKGCGETTLNLILKDESWANIIDEYGNSQSKQVGLSTTTKGGFMKLLEKVGIGVTNAWNEINTSPSVSVATPLKVNMTQAYGKKGVEFIPLAEEFVKQLQELSDIDNEINNVG